MKKPRIPRPKPFTDKDWSPWTYDKDLMVSRSEYEDGAVSLHCYEDDTRCFLEAPRVTLHFATKGARPTHAEMIAELERVETWLDKMLPVECGEGWEIHANELSFKAGFGGPGGDSVRVLGDTYRFSVYVGATYQPLDEKARVRVLPMDLCLHFETPVWEEVVAILKSFAPETGVVDGVFHYEQV